MSLCGAVDLDAGLAEGIGNGAVLGFLGGSDETIDDRLQLAAPMRHLPIGIPQILIHGLDDTVVPPDHSQRYVERAVTAGDDATFIPLPGVGHGDVIHPHAATFPEVLGAIRRLTGVEVR
jgi:pimeloyl-ACP methyl ester carboxylesterase